MAIELVIFDCDGVLVDSEPLANEELRLALGHQGLEMSMKQVIESFVGLSMKQVLDIAEDRLGHYLPDNFLDQLQVKTFAAFEKKLEPVEGIRDILTQLQNMPQKICVASSGSFEKMDMTLGLTGLKGFFQDNIFSASQVPRGKPYPDLFLYAAEMMEAAPARCLVVEDSLPGVQAAAAAGMAALAYCVRGQDRQLAMAGGIVISDMADVVKYMDD